MKNIIFAAAIFCFTLFNTVEPNAEVQYGAYVAPKLTYSFFTGDYIKGKELDGTSKSGTGAFGGGLALGYDFSNFGDGIPVRAELEFTMRTDAKFDVEDETLKVPAPKTLFTNGYVDFYNDTDFTPYLTAGVGVSFVDVDTNFAWNVGTGCRYALTENTSLDFAVKYIDYGYYKFDKYEANLTSIDTSVGVVYTF